MFSRFYYLLNSSNAFAVKEDELLPLEEFDSFIFICLMVLQTKLNKPLRKK